MKTLSKKNILLIGLVITFLLASFVFGIGVSSMTAKANGTTEIINTRIVHMSDIHVMPDQYVNIYSSDFIADTQGNTKLLEQSSSALLTGFQEIYDLGDDAPMYIIISGDLTSNGELEAHKLVAEACKQMTTAMRARPGFANFQIFVIPGNHDMYNDRAVSYMPTAEELSTWKTNWETQNPGAPAEDMEDDLIAYLSTYKTRSVPTTTSKDIFEIYEDFGYGGPNMAENIKVKFFIDSDYWYDDNTKVERNPDGTYKSSTGLDVQDLTDSEVKAWKNGGKNMELIAEKGRIGACTYIAEIDTGKAKDITVIGVNGDGREYTGEKETIAKSTAGGWNETTGGLVTEKTLEWIVASTHANVERGDLMLATIHYNLIPHFAAEDELISLFTLDNWEQTAWTFAENGIRYAFTGHQHANDVVDYVSQKGNVVYDFETGSMISYGSAFRIVDFTQTFDANGSYYEDVKTTLQTLAGNNGSENAFTYVVYRVKTEAEANYSSDILTDTIFDIYDPAEHLQKLDYANLGIISLCKTQMKDGNGNPCTIGDYLTYGMNNMLGDMVGKFVNPELYDKLTGMVSKLSMKYVKRLALDLIDDLETFDVYEFIPSADGKTFTLSAATKPGYDLVSYVSDLADWLLSYDFSYGQVTGGVTLNDLLMLVYGGHLAGTSDANVDAEILPLVAKLENGDFVQFLVDTLADALLPQLDLILDAPIRFDSTKAALPAGTGFDITSSFKASSDNGIDTTIKSLLTNYGTKTLDADGNTCLRFVLKDAQGLVNDLLYTEYSAISDVVLRNLATTIRGLAGALLADYKDIVDMALDYLTKYQETSLEQVVRTEVIDKYVTKAFTKNLGEYAKYLITSVDIDEFQDGSTWKVATLSAIKSGYAVNDANNYVIKTKQFNATTAYKGHAYFKTSDGKDKLEVEATQENGLLPGMITSSITADGTSTTKNVRWFTRIETDIADKIATGSYPVPNSYIKYSLNQDLAGAEAIKANGVNKVIEIPTVDLGILYFNLNYRAHTYNIYNISLTGLEKGKTYYYAVGSDTYGWSDIYSFRTDDGDKNMGFIAFTDIQGSIQKNYLESAENIKIMQAYLKEQGLDYEFTISCGDNVDYGKNIWQYEWLLNSDTNGIYGNGFVTLAGNHEDSNYSLSNIVALPNDDIVKVSDVGFYYSYNYGNVHFTIVDTNDIVDNALSSTQIEWLEKDLGAAQKDKKIDFIIVSLHKGPYTAGSHAFDKDVIGLRAQLTPIFAKYDVDLVLQGHDHTYSVSEYIGEDGKKVEVKTNKKGEVIDPDGVLYINLGTMGDKYYNYLYSDEVSLVKRESVPTELEGYFDTEKGNLELTETPCFAYVSTDGKKLSIKAYTIVNGKVVTVDDIVISKGSDLSTGAIIGIVVGGVVVVGAGVVVAIFFILKKKKAIPDATNMS